MTEIVQSIPARLKNVAVNGHVAGADDIMDDAKGKTQDIINSDVDSAIGTDSTEGSIKGRIKSLETLVGSDSVGTQINKKINALDATKSQSAGADGLALSVVEENGKITSISGSIAANTYDAYGAASAAQSDAISVAATDATTKVNAAKSEIKGNATSACDTLGEAEALISAEKTRAQAAEQLLQEQYNALTQSDIIVGALPASGTKNKIYRIPGTSSYSDYMWNGSSWVLMATYNNAIDDKLTLGSHNIPESGGVYQECIGNVLYGYYLDSSGNLVEDANFGISDYIPVGQYWYRWKSESTTHRNSKLVQYAADKSFIGYLSDYGSGGTSFQITSPNVKFIRISVGLGDVHGRLEVYTSETTFDDVWVSEYGLKIELYNDEKKITNIDGRASSLEERIRVDEDNITDLQNTVVGGRFEDGYYLDSTGNKVADASYGISDYIPVIGGRSYTWFLKGPYNSDPKIVEYRSNKTVRDYHSPVTAGSDFTTQNDTAYVRCSYYIDSSENRLIDNTNNKVIWSTGNGLKEDVTDIYGRIDNIISNTPYQTLQPSILSAIENERQRVCKAISSNRFAFGWITDTHLGSATLNDGLRRLYTISKYAKASALKAIVHGGDMVSGEATIAADMKVMTDGKESVSDNYGIDTFFIRGNHDGGHRTWKSIVDGGGIPTEADIVSNKDWYNMMVSRLNGIVKDSDNPMGGYYYKDYEFEKIRMVLLNPYDWDGSDADGVYNAMYDRALIAKAQIEWLIFKALNFSEKGSDKSNWQVLVFTHDGFVADDDNLDDGYQIDSILNAFNTGTSYSGSYSRASKPTIPEFSFTADFTSQGAIRCAAVFNGHTHRDRVIFSFGIPHITTAADHVDLTENMPAGSTLPMPRVAGEVSENCWDSVVLGLNNYIYLYRFGAKESGKDNGDRIIYPNIYTVRVGESVELTSMLTGTWSIYSVSEGYYVPIVNGVEGTPVGTQTVHASINNGIVTGLSVGEATACVQRANGEKEFFGIKIVD